MTNLILFNKPFKVLSQFTDSQGRGTLSDYIHTQGYYPAGRLDYDSEGLLLLTNQGKLQNRISHPKFKLPKCYWAQVEGQPSALLLQQLAKGIMLKDGMTLPAKLSVLNTEQVEQTIWSREPPIRQRQAIPTTWLSITLREGRNRQVRRMTAAIGHPTLRLIRMSIGPLKLAGLHPGQTRHELFKLPKDTYHAKGVRAK